MPNHVTNKIDKNVAKLLMNDNGEIDFNSIIPMPESLTDPDPQRFDCRAKMALGIMDPEVILQVRHNTTLLDKSQIHLLITAIENIRDYSFSYWYPWAIENWGTKWNAYNATENQFDTAWSHPVPVFLALSKAYPDLEILVKYADSDVGSNCGTVLYKAGEVVKRDVAPKWQSMCRQEKEKWLRFALEIIDPDRVEERIRYILGPKRKEPAEVEK